MKRTAEGAFIEAISEISERLEELKAFVVDEHMGVAPETLNWGHVGTAKHLLETLNEAAVFAGTRPEDN